MFGKRLLWLTKCLLFCLLGIFIAGRLSDLLNPLVWWTLHLTGTTSQQRPSFIAAYDLPLLAIYGFFLGLIPLHRLQELLASFFGNLRFKPQLRTEIIFSRPLLWAWAPVGFILVYRLLTYPLGRDHSVLGSATYGESRYEHFFGALTLRSAPDLRALIFDRFVLTVCIKTLHARKQMVDMKNTPGGQVLFFQARHGGPPKA
jgi:hypothetical protein